MIKKEKRNSKLNKKCKFVYILNEKRAKITQISHKHTSGDRQTERERKKQRPYLYENIERD